MKPMSNMKPAFKDAYLNVEFGTLEQRYAHVLETFDLDKSTSPLVLDKDGCPDLSRMLWVHEHAININWFCWGNPTFLLQDYAERRLKMKAGDVYDVWDMSLSPPGYIIRPVKYSRH